MSLRTGFLSEGLTGEGYNSHSYKVLVVFIFLQLKNSWKLESSKSAMEEGRRWWESQSVGKMVLYIT